MRERMVHVAAPILVCALIVCGFVVYQNYVKDKIFQESTDHLLVTYEQVDRTFSLFSQRNWNMLSDRDLEFADAQGEAETEAVLEHWRDFVNRRDSWMISDLYLFNESNDYMTASGRQGRADSIAGVFDELHQDGKPVVSSYTSSEGKRKIVYAVRASSPIVVDGVTYTGLAASYENGVVEDMITSNVFDGVSDCYVIRENGDVVLSLSTKTQFTEHIDNMFTFLGGSVSFERGSLEELQSGVESGQSGGALCAYSGESNFVVWQASSTENWSIIGVVHDEAVNSGMKDIQSVTMIVLAGLFVCALVLVVGGVMLSSRRRLRHKEGERAELARQKELSDELFKGITRIVDRFAIYDLENDTYEYREHEFDEPIYPLKGRYRDFVETMSKRYIVTSDPDNAKIGSQISPEHLREVMRSETDVVRFEYAGREGGVYKMMNVVPVEWTDDGRLKKVLLSCQDISRRVELETITRADGLTGLFNERYFAEILHKFETLRKPFTLLYLDLDRFKPVNDTYGHDAGDLLLKEVAHRIQGCIRNEDFAFRIGGDEFAIVLSAELGDVQLEGKVAILKESICRPIEVDGHVVCVGVSCGCARFPSDGTQAAAVRKTADKRMYEDKERNHAGR